MTNEMVVQTPAEVAGWEQQGTENAGAQAIIQRERSELESAIVVAHRFVRDEAEAYTKIIKSCQRPTFAEGARYSFPRGGSTVSGPSVQLAREIARCWRNLRYGIRIVSMDDEQVHLRAYALDMETNNFVEVEDRFARLIQRKQNGRAVWVAPDERELRELQNRRGAIAERNAILKVVPPDIVEDALRAVEETIRRAASGELKQDRQAAIRRLALAFDGLGVTTEMLTDHLGHDLDLITEDELAELRGVYASIRDGNTKRGDHFDFGARRDTGPSEDNARLEEAEAAEPVRDEAAQTERRATRQAKQAGLEGMS
jgi:predicted RNA-binding protein YlxR (DUF448 family)